MLPIVASHMSADSGRALPIGGGPRADLGRDRTWSRRSGLWERRARAFIPLRREDARRGGTRRQQLHLSGGVVVQQNAETAVRLPRSPGHQHDRFRPKRRWVGFGLVVGWASSLGGGACHAFRGQPGEVLRIFPDRVEPTDAPKKCTHPHQLVPTVLVGLHSPSSRFFSEKSTKEPRPISRWFCPTQNVVKRGRGPSQTTYQATRLGTTSLLAALSLDGLEVVKRTESADVGSPFPRTVNHPDEDDDVLGCPGRLHEAPARVSTPTVCTLLGRARDVEEKIPLIYFDVADGMCAATGLEGRATFKDRREPFGLCYLRYAIARYKARAKRTTPTPRINARLVQCTVPCPLYAPDGRVGWLRRSSKKAGDLHGVVSRMSDWSGMRSGSNRWRWRNAEPILCRRVDFVGPEGARILHSVAKGSRGNRANRR